MQTIRIALLGSIAFLSSAGAVLGQADGRDSRGGRPRGGFGRDPNEMFNSMTNGKDVWNRADITDSWRQQSFDRIAEQVGAKNGQITRDQYISYMQKRMAERSGGSLPTPADVPPAPSVPTFEKKDTVTVPNNLVGGSDDAASLARRQQVWGMAAESSFRRLDTNNDGYLDENEMLAGNADDLRAELNLWDKDGNRLIDINEYKAFYIANRERQMAERNAAVNDRSGLDRTRMGSVAPPMQAQKNPEERRPVVYTNKNIPKELSWFKNLDRDKDGQVSLYEWRQSGRSMDEFRKYDRNNDGFITVEEVLYVMAQDNKNAQDNGDSNGRVVKKDTSGSGPASFSGMDVSGSGPITIDRSRSDSGKPPPVRATIDFSKYSKPKGGNKDK